MSAVLFYKRPDLVCKLPGPLGQSECQKYVERTLKKKGSIPPALSFDRIVANKTLPPCSLIDFMDYLLYVSFDAENLQFYLWLHDYTKRFNALKKEEKALSPEWGAEISEELVKVIKLSQTAANLESLGLIDSDDSAKGPSYALTEIAGAHGSRPVSAGGTDCSSFISHKVSAPDLAQEVRSHDNNTGGLNSPALQPFRAEVAKAIATYIAPDAPRELNISHRDREAVLQALQHTTHPSAFALACTLVEGTLRGVSHPNFIRWTICNGNKPRVIAVRGACASNIVLGLLLAIFLTLSSLNRWYRVLASVWLFIGISGLIAAYKGLCMILHTGHKRTVNPWEDVDRGSIYTGPDSTKGPDDEEAAFATSERAVSPKPKSFDSFGSSNSYLDEPWVDAEKRKPLLKRVFEKTTRVQDSSLKVLQDRIVWQAQITALLITIVITAGFVALPKGEFF
ncbi:hypothetical protein W97_06009 [Coniosporium apollinis CBS 100218]|uniref:RGS domain-containing protein n=1 Tax=Coniosporium apollinis (strain CBS 100218) TaxID=1168221 RepID=R7YYM7_CONA1|nr:uncharacterized protein W97_06009 [Coniosporium apollinis CBS 100218]EON66761.1 hypothetical protein W97_06009 [Coniosporium apollinis CBS 100218]